MASNSDVPISLTVCDPERDFILLLLTLYRENPVLWDAKNEHYSNKYRRQIALNNICNALRAHKPKYTIQELKKKLNILRTNFNKERNKSEKRKSTSSENVPEPTLWYYSEMTFLIGQEVPAKKAAAATVLDSFAPRVQDSIAPKIQDSIAPLVQDSFAPQVQNSNPDPKPIRSIKRKQISIFSDPSNLKRSENEEDLLAKCWAMKLRKLAPDQRLYAEKIINDTLFEAEMGTLTRNGVTFNAKPSTWARYSSESEAEPPEYKCS